MTGRTLRGAYSPELEVSINKLENNGEEYSVYKKNKMESVQR